MVDPKGIEPSNLTDANRALSQLSYGPIQELSYICVLYQPGPPAKLRAPVQTLCKPILSPYLP